jgi:V/A-type H+/Na+-transporting ATPase subunit B
VTGVGARPDRSDPAARPLGQQESDGAAPVEYHDVRGVHGPLLIVGGVRGVGWDEFAEIHLPGQGVRHGVVLDAAGDTAVVQVLEGTDGIAPTRASVAFTGGPLRVRVGDGWLGRACNGRGEPIDGGPPVTGEVFADVNGAPINPVARETPQEPVLTGVSMIDALTTLVRGQKLPIFSIGGLPHLELATQIAAQAHAGGEPFAVVFAGMGITHADAAAVRDALESRAADAELVLLLNTADDPVIERILTPRLALSIAEHLAFAGGRHVLVVMADMTSYCEAVRQVGSARGEVPGRRGYPGYLYSDLASLYERCGRLRGRPGSITEVPVLTMPAGDLTHPVPALTGYITEGQIVLSADRHARGVYPPIDPLSSLSRLMRRGAGPGRTRDDHLDLAAQVHSLLARARDVTELADLLGADALSETERGYLAYAEAFDTCLGQRPDEARGLDDTLDRAWRAVSVLPRNELAMLPVDQLDRRYQGGPGHVPPGTVDAPEEEAHGRSSAAR